MNLRLFPVAAAAVFGLIGLKAGGLVAASFAEIPAMAEEAAKPEAAPAAARPPKAEAFAEGAAAVEQGQSSDLIDPQMMSPAEIAVLQSLADRRKELDARETELETREQLIAAAEKRVEERIAELKTLEARISELTDIRDAASEKQMADLVKVYETMKPAEAARIFEKLDETVLIPVAQRMKPAKIAAVMAQMDPEKAQALTVTLARRLDNAKAEPAPAAPAAAPTPEGTPPG